MTNESFQYFINIYIITTTSNKQINKNIQQVFFFFQLKEPRNLLLLSFINQFHQSTTLSQKKKLITIDKYRGKA